MEIHKGNKQVQELTVALLKVFIKICEENNLCYYFAGGALIGVMRHKGFIPWDDDIDIVMPRKDFDRFHEILKTEMPKGYGICNRYTDSNWHFAISQFIDMESEIEIHLAEKPRLAHIWLDIFPIDGLPNGKAARWIRVKNVLLHRYLIQIAYVDTQVDSNRERPWYEGAILKICKMIPLNKLLNTNRLLDNMEKLLKKSDFDKSEFVGDLLGRYREREIVPKIYFGNPKKGIFEGQVVNIPAMSHELLTSIYVDYMKLPSEKDRIAHNVKIIKSRDI